LHGIWSRAVAAELAPHFVVDLGETREFYYYTGVMFHLLAEGPGEPLGSGGRYDSLFERFDLPCPAAGFAFDISNVCWALDESGASDEPMQRVLVCTAAGTDPDLGTALARELRVRGVACAVGPETEPDVYAARWDYTHMLVAGGARAELKRLPGGAATPVGGKTLAEIARDVAAHLGVLEEV